MPEKEITPEEKAELQIWDWLKTKSEFVKEVYFNRKNRIGWSKFVISGTGRRPDFLIKYDNGFGEKFCVVEVKPSAKSKNILKGSKIIDYFQDYASETAKYFIEGKRVEIDFFLVATELSLFGHLFEKEEILDNTKDPNSYSKYIASTKYQNIPKKEGSRTFEFVRFLWQDFSKVRNDYEKICGLGILIGNIDDVNKPYMMISYVNKKGYWSQKWWKI